MDVLVTSADKKTPRQMEIEELPKVGWRILTRDGMREVKQVETCLVLGEILPDEPPWNHESDRQYAIATEALSKDRDAGIELLKRVAEEFPHKAAGLAAADDLKRLGRG